MHSKPLSSFTAMLLLTPALSLPAWAADAHVHGIAEMTLVEDAGMVVLELQVPGISLAGFEHAPNSAADAARISAVLGALNDSDKVVNIAGGECKRISVEAKSSYPPFSEKIKAHEHEHEHDEHSTHNAFTASYQFECAKPESITELQLPVLSTFPSIETLSVQWILGGKQGTSRLTGKNAILPLGK